MECTTVCNVDDGECAEDIFPFKDPSGCVKTQIANNRYNSDWKWNDLVFKSLTLQKVNSQMVFNYQETYVWMKIDGLIPYTGGKYYTDTCSASHNIEPQHTASLYPLFWLTTREALLHLVKEMKYN